MKGDGVPDEKTVPFRRGGWDESVPGEAKGAEPSARPASAGRSAGSTPRASTPSQLLHAAAAPAQRPVSEYKPPARRRPPVARPRRSLISRGERILLAVLLAAVAAMAWYLLHFRREMDAHFRVRGAAVPLSSATGVIAPVVLVLANDQTGVLAERPIAFPLPRDPNTRARVVLQKLLAEYGAPGSPHPLAPSPPGLDSVAEVFLLPVPGGRGQLAIVDLTRNFVQQHPSGIEPETLTLLSMIATLHANLPQITEVHFLVDGEGRATLAGHADLTRTYLASATEMAPGEAFTTGAR